MSFTVVYNMVYTEQTALGHVYIKTKVESYSDGASSDRCSITNRKSYCPNPGTAESVGCWSYYYDLPYVRAIYERGNFSLLYARRKQKSQARLWQERRESVT